MKYAFIHGEEGNYAIANMCRWARVSRSGYYAWRDREPSDTARRRAMLAELIRFLFDDSDGTYGYRRIHAELRRSGYTVDDETVRGIMRDLELVACQPKPFRPVTTVPGDHQLPVPDLVHRDFTAPAPACTWVGDMTYIPTWEGFVYLATVLDCFSKKVVGFAIADHMRTELIIDAMKMAARNSTIIPGETIFHSDHGAQYTSREFADYANRIGLRRSMGRTGVCWDNAWAESFNGTLKNERVNRTVYPTKQHARVDIERYIQLRYNRRRLHSALGYRTPDEVETEWYENNQAA